jgi:hypothetical protein
MANNRSPTMSLQRYAVVLAHLDHFRAAEAFAVLRALQIDPRVWHAIDMAFAAELALASKRHESKRALQFTSVFHRTRRALMSARPTLEAVASECARTEALRTAALSGAVSPPSVSSVAEARPTRAVLPPAILPSAALPPHVPAGQVSPWSAGVARSASPQASRPVAVPSARRERRAAGDETVVMPALTDERPLPFVRGSGAAAAPPRAAEQVSAEGEGMAGGTSIGPAVSDSDDLPFAGRSK